MTRGSFLTKKTYSLAHVTERQMVHLGDMKKQVLIVGAGPAGLFLSHLLHIYGIENLGVEHQSREYCENRQRAGILEQAPLMF